MRAFARRARVLVVVAALASAGALAVVPGSASAAASDTSVTVFLKPGDASELTRLAATSGPMTSARRAALERALPSAQAQQAVEDRLRAQGFTVTGVSSWSVTAKAPAGVVGALFGLASTVTGLLDRIPSSIRSLTSAAFQTDAGGPAVRSHAVSGTDLRNAYTSAALTASRTAPYNGRYRGARSTIATIQFAGWNRNDLATFAGHHHLPYNSSTLTEVPVNQSSVPNTSSSDGSVEVALDQESILATNPYAHQRAYFAPNNNAGFIAAFSKVLDDVVGNVHAYRGGDRHITALSISWGGCETDNPDTNATTNNILKSLVAAGVTVFSASGDSGAYDCSNYVLGNPVSSRIGVDFPSSSPYVIGVGGTTLSKRPGGPNNGHNWVETAWSCSGQRDCAGGLLAFGGGTGGSGGGTSSTFAKPSYQSGISGSGRMVPDIAAVADPATGLNIYSSYKSYGWVTVGGTSLAAPVEAALFTNMLSAHGLSHGIGNIHAKLYAAARASGSFRDVTSGTNTYAAGRGYDLVTGLGAPLWPAIGQRIFGTSKLRPKVRWSVRKKARHRRVTLHWNAAKRGLMADVTVRSPKGVVIARRTLAAPKGSITFRGHLHKRYRATIQVVDKSHRISPLRHYKFKVRRR